MECRPPLRARTLHGGTRPAEDRCALDARATTACGIPSSQRRSRRDGIDRRRRAPRPGRTALGRGTARACDHDAQRPAGPVRLELAIDRSTVALSAAVVGVGPRGSAQIVVVIGDQFPPCRPAWPRWTSGMRSGPCSVTTPPCSTYRTCRSTVGTTRRSTAGSSGVGEGCSTAAGRGSCAHPGHRRVSSSGRGPRAALARGDEVTTMQRGRSRLPVRDVLGSVTDRTRSRPPARARRPSYTSPPGLG